MGLLNLITFALIFYIIFFAIPSQIKSPVLHN